MQFQPSEAVFADGRKPKRLALRPEAVNVRYPTIDPDDMDHIVEMVDGVAVLCIDGPLEHRMTWWQNYESIAIAFKACCDDPSVRAIMLKFDSPGGEVSGLNETVAIMQEMKAKSGKPVVGYVDEACYSAAYALAMVCDEIFLPESGGVGSIGVITAMIDVTSMNEKDGVRVEVIASGTKKTDGHPCVAITDGAILRTQKAVDKLAVAFFDLVAKGRNIDAKTVEGFEAGTFMGHDAVSAGLADGVMSLQECLTLAVSTYNPTSSNSDMSDGIRNSVLSDASKKEAHPMAGKIAAAKAAEDAKRAAAASAADAKVTKTKTVTTDTHEEEVDDGKEEEAEVPEDEPGDDEPADDEEDAKASASLVSLARHLTGKTKASHVAAALRGMAAQTAHAATLQARVDALENNAKAAKLSALITVGTRAGKLTPAQRVWALTQSPESLKAFLDAAPSVVRTVDEKAVEPSAVDALTPDEVAMCASANPPVDIVKYAATKAAIRANSMNGKRV